MREDGRAGLGALAVAALFLASCAGLTPVLRPVPDGFGDKGIDYRLVARSEPRPLRIHIATVDAGGAGLRVVTPLLPPRSAARGAEARLVDPAREADSIGSLLLVNASAFSVIGCAPGRRPLAYLPGMPVDIAGLAMHEGRLVSPSQDGFAALGLGPGGAVAAGYDLGSLLGARPEEAAAGFAMLVEGGLNVASADGTLAARTAVGGDGSGRLVFVVVEGGAKGRSEGLSLRELADLMLELEADWAINMDGGGSSVMILRRGGRELRVSEGEHRLLGLGLPPRPVPNFIAVLPR